MKRKQVQKCTLYTDELTVPRSFFSTLAIYVWRATWQDARRHGVIKVPLSMGNCNPPISPTPCYVFIRATATRLFSFCLERTLGTLSFDPRPAYTRYGVSTGWSLHKPLSPSCNARYTAARVDEWRGVKAKSTAEKWLRLVTNDST